MSVREAGAAGAGRAERALAHLGARQRSVDARGGFGGVSAEERVLVDEEDAAAALEHGVRRREAREAAAENDDLSHLPPREDKV
jgi:hypothetical protein